MKNNTKLIMETWRRFLKEGLEGIDEDGMVEEMHNHDDASSMSPVEDEDLESDRNMIDRMHDMDDMDDMGEFNPYESSPIPPEGLDREDEYDSDDELYRTDGDSLNPDIAYDSGSFDDSLDMMP